MSRWLLSLVLAGGFCLSLSLALAGEKTAAERGWEALSGRTFTPPGASRKAYDNTWKQWGLSEKPVDYARAFRERYGLHPAPFDNHGLPMGLREARGLLGKGLTTDCLLCHAGSVAGQTYLGLGNATLDFQALTDELAAADGFPVELPFRLSNVRGTIEAGAAFIYLLQFRDPDLKVQVPVELAYRDDLCEDIPAWWHLKRKKTIYHTGTVHSRSVRTLMAFMLTPLNSGEYIKKHQPVFADIQAYLLSLEPPRYPFPIDADLAARGKELFSQNCARCHGTYGPDGRYPNKVVALDEIGTDPTLAQPLSAESAEHYLKSWFAQEPGLDGKPINVDYHPGYQAPPLDGVWATAPYFHNGSVPTVYHVLNSRARPKFHTRSFRTGQEDYDPVKLGWKITVLDQAPDPKLPAIERRKVYDTTQPGRGNGGHTFGDNLTDEERMAVIEYLKTL
jgi:mono/diheme cytochrome c family protein